jgi:hypothetical protein
MSLISPKTPKNATGLKKVFNYFSIFTIMLGSTFGTFNTANAAAVVIADGATLTATQVDEAADTLSNTASDVTASFNSAASAITFATLTSAEDSSLTLSFDDLTDANAETTDITGNITAATGSTVALTVTDGLLDLGGSVIETGTGVVTINVAAGQEVNTTGASKTIALKFYSWRRNCNFRYRWCSNILQVQVGAGVLDIDGATTFSSTVTASGAATIDAAVTFAGDTTFNAAVDAFSETNAD